MKSPRLGAIDIREALKPHPKKDDSPSRADMPGTLLEFPDTTPSALRGRTDSWGNEVLGSMRRLGFAFTLDFEGPFDVCRMRDEKGLQVIVSTTGDDFFDKTRISSDDFNGNEPFHVVFRLPENKAQTVRLPINILTEILDSFRKMEELLIESGFVSSPKYANTAHQVISNLRINIAYLENLLEGDDETHFSFDEISVTNVAIGPKKTDRGIEPHLHHRYDLQLSNDDFTLHFCPSTTDPSEHLLRVNFHDLQGVLWDDKLLETVLSLRSSDDPQIKELAAQLLHRTLSSGREFLDLFLDEDEDESEQGPKRLRDLPARFKRRIKNTLRGAVYEVKEEVLDRIRAVRDWVDDL